MAMTRKEWDGLVLTGYSILLDKLALLGDRRPESYPAAAQMVREYREWVLLATDRSNIPIVPPEPINVANGNK